MDVALEDGYYKKLIYSMKQQLDSKEDLGFIENFRTKNAELEFLLSKEKSLVASMEKGMCDSKEKSLATRLRKCDYFEWEDVALEDSYYKNLIYSMKQQTKNVELDFLLSKEKSLAASIEKGMCDSKKEHTYVQVVGSCSSCWVCLFCFLVS
uniref:Uncharacterized protein n=1 Tax=Lactuca sativa TaxID=4236 RepID=A0A9R1WHJ3_LACSA|nr:hypothetical protein LSAT_V11C200067480 [Lactuca sativa]